ncbi:MAG: hypothetical protein IT385_00615 [Deltaproteobacteria bacterium]|nr:hypothetical protein [Deltaproteobacteria bacterium]
MLTRLIGVALAAMLSSSCYFTTDDGWIWWATDDPELLDAEAGCFRDVVHTGLGEYAVNTWYFEAEVYDFDGPDDIMSVEAHVYDLWLGRRVGWFELDPTTHMGWWYSEWPESMTGLDCYNPDYEVDFIVTDYWGGWDTRTVVPWTW